MACGKSLSDFSRADFDNFYIWWVFRLESDWLFRTRGSVNRRKRKTRVDVLVVCMSTDMFWSKVHPLTLFVWILVQTGSLSRSDELRAENLPEIFSQGFKKLAQENNIDAFNKLYDYPQTPPADGETFDFIIVGSGSSGSVLVNRLSENPNWKVLVLEAGDEPDYLTEIPMMTTLHQFTHHNWGYVTEKQDGFGLGFENQQLHWPRGRGLGGSSLINFMIYSRGNKGDYDRWAGLGNEGWSYADVLPYFKKMENSKLARRDAEYHGEGGELEVEDVGYRTKCAELFVEAAQESGYEYVDVNGRSQIGVEFSQATTKNRFRCSGEKAYVRPIRRTRRNLVIRINSHVTKVLIDEAAKTATGVEYVHKGVTYTAKAAREVILSAGTIGSPHILMLSGVGPSQNLQTHGIPVILNLPVGQKLYDHTAYVGLVFTLNDSSLTYDNRKAEDPSAFLELHRTNSGPLQVLSSLEAVLYFKSNASTDPEPNYPDVELVMLSMHIPSDKGVILKRALRITDEIYDALFKPLEDKPCWGLFPIILHPKSFGRMELRSSDPLVHPAIYPNYLSDPHGDDLKTIVAAIREAIRLGESPLLKQFGNEVNRTPVPGCEAHEYDSDEYWECAARHLMTTVYHPTTTCKMGPESDPEAVVDHRLRVRGIKNLRVVDASVIPVTITGHTNVPAFMIAEKAADLIAEDWTLDVKSEL